jgi:hypothetical protein
MTANAPMVVADTAPAATEPKMLASPLVST